jgi:hypothetical protein
MSDAGASIKHAAACCLISTSDRVPPDQGADFTKQSLIQLMLMRQVP